MNGAVPSAEESKISIFSILKSSLLVSEMSVLCDGTRWDGKILQDILQDLKCIQWSTVCET